VGSGLLLFGATDGNLFALNLADGTLNWKTLVDSQGMIDGNNLPADAKSFSDPAISPIVVDNQTGTVTWGFLITQRQIGGIIGENLYTGVFCSIDLSNGDILKTSKFQTNCTTDNTGIGLAPGKSVFYLTAGLDLWIIDKATGIPTLIEHYEHYTIPVLNNNIVYLAADLHLSACK
jgi:outer membrane protein assembly factor BamB